MNNLVSVREVLTRHEAGMAKGLLEEQAVESVISADDCGGWRPELTFARGGIQLLVRVEDKTKALEILKILDEPAEGNNDKQ